MRILQVSNRCSKSFTTRCFQSLVNFDHLWGVAMLIIILFSPRAGSGVVRIDPTKPGLVSVLYLSMHYMVLLFIRAPFYILLVFIAMCAVFWLFWLSYQYLPSDWLERLLFCVSLSSWVISLTVLGASVTNLIEPPRALATSTITWVRS